jgi:hypothetical protein
VNPKKQLDGGMRSFGAGRSSGPKGVGRARLAGPGRAAHRVTDDFY